MTSIGKFLSDEQDPKAVEKVLSKLTDMLFSGEELIYLAVQKRPAVNILPTAIAVTSRRIFYCEPANLGITMNFNDISWKSIKEVSFKEEIFGSKFICVPTQGENIVTDYIPKVQARKLYQIAHEQLENFLEQQRQLDLESKRSTASSFTVNTVTEQRPAEEPVAVTPPAPVAPPVHVEEQEDETTVKLRKLKTLYDKQLITLEEYEAKKADILDSF